MDAVQMIHPIALSRPCAYCGVMPHQHCRTKTGKRARWLHGVRTDALYALWRESYQEGVRDGRTQQAAKTLRAMEGMTPGAVSAKGDLCRWARQNLEALGG